MRQLALILLWFCAVNQAQAKSDDYLKLTINARVYVTACAAWVEDGAGVMSGNITLPPVPLSELQHPQTGAGETTFKVKFQCSSTDLHEIYEQGSDGTYRSLSVRFTAKGEVDPTTYILKNSHAESADGAKNIGFIIKDRGNNVVQFETATDPTALISATQTDAVCEHVPSQYQSKYKETDEICDTYSFPYTVEYAAYGDNPGPGLVDADATVTVDWQ